MFLTDLEISTGQMLMWFYTPEKWALACSYQKNNVKIMCDVCVKVLQCYYFGNCEGAAQVVTAEGYGCCPAVWPEWRVLSSPGALQTTRSWGAINACFSLLCLLSSSIHCYSLNSRVCYLILHIEQRWLVSSEPSEWLSLPVSSHLLSLQPRKSPMTQKYLQYLCWSSLITSLWYIFKSWKPLST